MWQLSQYTSLTAFTICPTWPSSQHSQTHLRPQYSNPRHTKESMAVTTVANGSYHSNRPNKMLVNRDEQSVTRKIRAQEPCLSQLMPIIAFPIALLGRIKQRAGIEALVVDPRLPTLSPVAPKPHIQFGRCRCLF